jgi:hypothetical protein
VIDNLSILLSHALLAIALWRLMNSEALDTEQPPASDDVSARFMGQARTSKAVAKGRRDA